MSDVKRQRAARSLANGNSYAQAARDAGISKATLTRWRAEPGFQTALETERTELDLDQPQETTVQERAETGLSARVDEALRVIDRGLAGDKSVSVQMARLALDVVKAARTLEPKAAGETGPSTLTALIAKLDAEDVG